MISCVFMAAIASLISLVRTLYVFLLSLPASYPSPKVCFSFIVCFVSASQVSQFSLEIWLLFSIFINCCCSVAQSYPSLCDPMDCSTPGFPVPHHLLELAQTHVPASVLPMNIQDWFPLEWTGVIPLQSKRLSRVFSNTTVQKHQFFGAQLSFSPTLTSIHDYWKNHTLH